VECGVWSVEVWSVECGSVECGVWRVWSVECGVWSVTGVWSVECGVWSCLDFGCSLPSLPLSAPPCPSLPPFQTPKSKLQIPNSNCHSVLCGIIESCGVPPLQTPNTKHQT